MNQNERRQLQEMITTIENSRRFEQRPGVEICRIVLEKLGHPQQNLRVIHVAGTNGKGSVCSYLSHILKNAGYRTGLFTSPHLIRFSERIQINGSQIPDEALYRYAKMVLDTDFGVSLTMFDYCLAIALLYFQEQHCDFVILETGLGGALDSTNAVKEPVLCAITAIGYDHMAILGDTLAQIAAEKAGILKAGIPAVIGVQQPEADEVLQNVCKEKQIPLRHVEKSCFCRLTGSTNHFLYKGKEYAITMPAAYQMENALTAIEATEALRDCGYEISDEALQTGLYETTWSGRMQILSTEPFFLVDGAHNENGVQALKESLNLLYPGEKFLFLTAVLADKDYESMMERMLPLAWRFVTVTPHSSRALQSGRLADFLTGKGARVTSCQTSEEALQMIADIQRQNSQIKTVAFGSLYFIGELLEKFDMK